VLRFAVTLWFIDSQEKKARSVEDITTRSPLNHDTCATDTLNQTITESYSKPIIMNDNQFTKTAKHSLGVSSGDACMDGEGGSTRSNDEELSSRISRRQPVVIHESFSNTSSETADHRDTVVKFQIQFLDYSSHSSACLDYDSIHFRIVLSASDQSFDTIYLDLLPHKKGGDRCHIDPLTARYSKKKMILTVEVTVHSTS